MSDRAFHWFLLIAMVALAILCSLIYYREGWQDGWRERHMIEYNRHDRVQSPDKGETAMKRTAFVLVLLFAVQADGQSKVGDEIDLNKFSGRKIRVIDEKRFTVELCNPQTGKAFYTAAIDAKTEGMVDNQVVTAGDWARVLGTSTVKYAGTAKVRGKTLYLFEPLKELSKEKK